MTHSDWNWIGVGVGLGTSIGIATNNLSFWIAIGVAFGAIMMRKNES